MSHRDVVPWCDGVDIHDNPRQRHWLCATCRRVPLRDPPAGARRLFPPSHGDPARCPDRLPTRATNPGDQKQ